MLFLFIDDDKSVTEAFVELAASLGHCAEVAHSGSEALRMAGQTRYDTVFMDIRLGDIDGRTLCDYIRAVGPSREACIVAITGLSDFDVATSPQFDGCLRKPVTALELTGVIGRC